MWNFLAPPAHKQELPAEGTRLPLTVTELRSALVPRTCPKRASPWSYCTLIPEIRFKASPMLESGNLPTWSADTTLVIPKLLFWALMARRCPWNAPPTTTSWSSTPSFSTTSFSKVRPAGIVSRIYSPIAISFFLTIVKHHIIPQNTIYAPI